jgi:diguanylate cyclase (GGDEF)-like protein/PAS domain S-box-containing protein
VRGGRHAHSGSNLTRPLAVLLILNLFVVGMTSFVLVRSYDQERDKSFLVADNLSREIDENLSRLIDKIDITLLAVADEAERQLSTGGMDRPLFEKVLARHDRRLPEAVGLRVTNAEGQIEFAVSNVATTNYDVSDREYFTRQRDDPNAGLFISTPFVGRLSTQPIVIFSRRYRAADGLFAGIVDVAVAIDSLRTILSAVDVGPHGNVSLWDSQLRFMARHSPIPIPDLAAVRSSPTLTELILSDARPTAFHTKSGVDGFERMFFYRKISRWPLHLTIGLADQDFMVGWWREVAYLSGLTVLLMLGSAAAFTALRRTMVALELSRAKADDARRQSDLILSSSGEGICGLDDAGRITFVNEAARRMLGWADGEGLGESFHAMVQHHRANGTDYPAQDSPIDLIHMDRISGGPLCVEDEVFWRRDGTCFPVEYTLAPMFGETGIVGVVTIFRDITERKDAERQLKEHQGQLEHIAHYDALTNLPNRVLLADRLHQALVQNQRRGQSLAVVYVDLDGFKSVNDHHGHDVGDELLIIVSQHMKGALREGDTLARIGGDEFVAVLVDLERPQDWEAVLTRVMKAVAEPVTIRERVLQVSASIGVTLYPDDNVDADLLLRHADQAMYLAKQAGKNRYYMFDVAQDAAVQSQRDTLDHVRRALEQGEFVLYYQPKVNMKTGRVIGAEALIRWRHPERGLLSPAAFLPFIEMHPISLEIGEWVIDAALNQAEQWNAAGLNLRISVNVAAYQLQQPDFVPRLTRLLGAHPDVPADFLELEILETSALEDISQVSELLHACQAIGVHAALDDFGTGYSSLTYLRRLPTELIKIDKSFVCDMLEDPEDLLIVRGIIGLAKAFQRDVIAEGVETLAHGKKLLSLGCELGQGYGIGRPMPAADMPDWLMTWRQGIPIGTAAVE